MYSRLKFLGNTSKIDVGFAMELWHGDGNSLPPTFFSNFEGWIFKQDMISLMITTGSSNSQDLIRIVKQSGHDFSGKHSCDVYFMDFMRYLCLEVNILKRVVWFCEKALRIYYLILFESKGPWMLKTDSLIF